MLKPVTNTYVPTGKLIVFDPTGRTVVEVSDEVTAVKSAALKDEVVTILFERRKRLVRATFDPKTLAKLGEQEIDVPIL